VHLGGGHTFIHRTMVRALVGIVDSQDGIGDAGGRGNARTPTGNRAVFGGKNEDGLLARSEEEVRRAAVENDACWSSLSTRREAWGWNGNDERPAIRRWREGIAV